MLKTNSKKAIENIKNYILENFEPEVYNPNFWDEIEQHRTNTAVPLNRFSVAAHFILDCFYNEKIKLDKRRMTELDLFFEWCQGLPSILDTCYYYNRSAIDDLAIILEETEAEKSKYTEAQAEQLLTHLIYREIKKVVK